MRDKKNRSGGTAVGSVQFYKRVILGGLAAILVGLFSCCVVLAVQNIGLRAQLRDQNETVRRLREDVVEQRGTILRLSDQLQMIDQLEETAGAGSTTPAGVEGGTPADAGAQQAPPVDFAALAAQISGGGNPAAVRLAEGNAVVPAQVFTAVSNRGDEMDLIFDLGNYRWLAKSLEVYRPGLADSYDLSVTFTGPENGGLDGFSVSGMKPVRAVSCASDVLPQTVRLEFSVGAEYAGQRLYLYHLDTSAGAYRHVTSVVADGNGKVTFPLGNGKDNVVAVAP